MTTSIRWMKRKKLKDFASEPVAQDTNAKDLFAKPGITKAEEFVSIDLPPGMGWAVPI